jgi:hypothetical protein
MTKKDWAKWHAVLGDLEPCELEAVSIFRDLMIEEELWVDWVYRFATLYEQIKSENLH